MNTVFSKFRKNDDGGLVVEAALLFPIFLAIILGGADGSFMLIQNHKLETQLSTAASFLSKSDWPEQHETAARQLAITGSPAGGPTAILKGWSVEDIHISYVVTTNNRDDYRNAGDVRTVQLSSTIGYQGLGILSSVLPKKPVLSASVQERIVGGGL